MVEQLADGLVLRRATAADAERIIELNGLAHRDPGTAEPNAWVSAWARDLATKPHPTFSIEDFFIVEEPGGRIVSSINLISQTWSFGGIEIPVGTPELVGTLDEYRGRGLVRRQMDALHRLSAERGEVVQAINGIPYFYRQFGYEMALELGGGRALPRWAVPKLADGQGEPFRVRPAGERDVPFLVDVDQLGRRRWFVSAVRDQACWRYELSDREAMRHQVAIVEMGAGDPIGFFSHGATLQGHSIWLSSYELRTGMSWLAVTPTVLRYLAENGSTMRTYSGRTTFEQVSLGLGTEHPAYRVLSDVTRVNPPYAFYVRVPDLPAFIRRIAPVLEQRLADSVAPGYSGELKLSFYRDGLRLRFEGGRLAEAASFVPTQRISPGAAWFPDLTFLQVLFGRRSLAQLKEAYSDVHTQGDETAPLVEALFPKVPSHVWAIS